MSQARSVGKRLRGLLLLTLLLVSLIPLLRVPPVSAGHGGVGRHALDFDGTNDVVNGTETNIPSGLNGERFTVEVWINLDVTTDESIFGINDEWFLRIESGVIWFRTFGASNDGDGSSLSTGQWYHVAAEWYVDTTNGWIATFLDGTLTKNATSITDTSSDTANVFEIGEINAGSNFDGTMDEIRVSNSIRYSASFTASRQEHVSDANTVGLWHMNQGSGATAFDTTSNQNDGTITGASWVEGLALTAPPHYGIDLDGTDDFVNVTDDNTLDLDVFTLAFWVKRTAAKTDDSPYIITKMGSAGFDRNYDCMMVKSTYEVKCHTAETSPDTIATSETSSTLTLDTWVHIAYVHNGTHQMLFYDGGLEDTDAVSFPPDTGTYPLYFGRYHSGMQADRYPELSLDEVCLANTALYSPTSRFLRHHTQTPTVLRACGI